MKVAVITGVCVRYDAISNAVRENIDVLLQVEENEVRLYSYRCDYDDIPHRDVSGLAEISSDPHFQQADLVLVHFGIYFSLLPAILLAPIGAKIVVVFHNVTPKALLPAWQHEEVDRSFKQLSLLSFADHVLCDSEFNRQVLTAAGVKTPASVHSLSVNVPIVPPHSKPSFEDGQIRLAFVGRFVQAKGPQDLLDAIELAMPELAQDEVHISLIGNSQFSSPELMADLRSRMKALHSAYRGRVEVEMMVGIDDQVKSEVLRSADIFVLPTYHEGFCVPILEALSSGCRVIAYENSNTPHIAGGFAELVETGNVASLSSAIVKNCGDVTSGRWKDGSGPASYEHFRKSVAPYVATFAPPNTRARLRKVLADVFFRDVGTGGLTRDDVLAALGEPTTA